MVKNVIPVPLRSLMRSQGQEMKEKTLSGDTTGWGIACIWGCCTRAQMKRTQCTKVGNKTEAD